jgi:hypothetical protein
LLAIPPGVAVESAVPSRSPKPLGSVDEESAEEALALEVGTFRLIGVTAIIHREGHCYAVQECNPQAIFWRRV